MKILVILVIGIAICIITQNDLNVFAQSIETLIVLREYDEFTGVNNYGIYYSISDLIFKVVGDRTSNIYNELQYHHQKENIFYKIYNDNNMKIHFRQSGGLTGGPDEVTLNVDKLNSSEKEKLNKLIRDTNLINKKSNISNPTPDSFQYDITISTNEKTNTFSIAENNIEENDENLQQLIDFLVSKLEQ
jgi:hypothetical protein